MNHINDIILISCPNGGGLVKIENNQVEIIDTFETTGIWVHDGTLIRAIQGAGDAKILVYNQDSFQYIVTKDISDIHDVLFFKNKLYVVSTGSNEVVTLSEFGKIQDRWKLPGNGDAWHLNCLDVWEDKVVVSAFGKFEESGQYKGRTKGSGFVFELETRRKVWQNLSQPHSPKHDINKKYICDSETRRLLIKNDNRTTEVLFEKYPRGMAITDNHIYVGLSNHRNIEQEETQDGAKIVILDKKNLSIVKQIGIAFNEIYEMKILSKELFDKLDFKQQISKLLLSNRM